MEITSLAKQYIYWPEVDNKYQKNFDISNVKLADIHGMLNTASEQSKESITAVISRFYALNEALGKLRQQENDILRTESLELYKQYTGEMEKISKNMFSYIFTICAMEMRHCHDYIVLRQKKSQINDSVRWQTNGIAKADKKYANFKEKLLKERYREHTTLAEFKSLVKVHELIENISNMTSYDRVEVNENFVPLLKDEKYADITVKDFLQSLKTLFTVDFFSSNYGGKPWANITEHALKFVTGEINPEVFIDQAFSLEHNGGQIFNKALIFKSPSQYAFNYNDLTQEYAYGLSQSASHVILNMQHQGQLLGFLLDPIPDPDINALHTKAAYNSFKQQELIPLNTTEEVYFQIIDNIHENITSYKTIRDKIIASSPPDFLDNIKKLGIKGEPIDSFKIFYEDKQGSILLSDKHKVFFALNDKLIYNFDIPKFNLLSNTNKVKKSSVQFTFEHFDTSSIPVEKMKKEILGNKAFGLAQMHEMNLPVPKAIVFPTTNSASFFHKKTQWQNELKTVLPTLKEYFKDSEGNPVLCSIRSGSAISMPGMMDTILNVGIDNTNYEQFCEKMGKGITNECAIKFMTLFTKSLLGEHVKYSSNIVGATNKFRKILTKHNIAHNKKGLFPLKAEAQYKWCLQAVFQSWHSERATAYREHNNIGHDIGTAAIAQQMVFGNLNKHSCTGVAFSRDCISGEKGIIGEFLPKAQGEDVVSGAVTPKNIKEMSQDFPEAYEQLVAICERLEKDTNEIQDIEFTVENKKLYILQKRKAVSSDLATTKLNYELMSNGLITREKMIEGLNVKSLLVQDCVEHNNQAPLAEGLIANPGVLRGIVVHSQEDMETYSQLYAQHAKDKNFGWIFYAPETSPEHAPIMIKTHGFITGNGGFTSHAAILARSWKKPCVVGIGNAIGQKYLYPGNLVTLDAAHGKVYEGILPVSSNRNDEMKNVVKTLLKHHKVNLKDIKTNNPFETVVNEINSQKIWIEELSACKIAKPKIKPQISNFLKLGEKVAMLLVKSQEDKKLYNFNNPIIINSLNEKEKQLLQEDSVTLQEEHITLKNEQIPSVLNNSNDSGYYNCVLDLTDPAYQDLNAQNNNKTEKNGLKM